MSNTAKAFRVAIVQTYDHLFLFRRGDAKLLELEIAPQFSYGNRWVEGEYELSKEFLASFPPSFSNRDSVVKIVEEVRDVEASPNALDAAFRKMVGEPIESYQFISYFLYFKPNAETEYSLHISPNEEMDEVGAIRELLGLEWIGEVVEERLCIRMVNRQDKEDVDGSMAHASQINVLNSPILKKLENGSDSQ